MINKRISKWKTFHIENAYFKFVNKKNVFN